MKKLYLMALTINLLAMDHVINCMDARAMTLMSETPKTHAPGHTVEIEMTSKSKPSATDESENTETKLTIEQRGELLTAKGLDLSKGPQPIKPLTLYEKLIKIRTNMTDDLQNITAPKARSIRISQALNDAISEILGYAKSPEPVITPKPLTIKEKLQATGATRTFAVEAKSSPMRTGEKITNAITESTTQEITTVLAQDPKADISSIWTRFTNQMTKIKELMTKKPQKISMVPIEKPEGENMNSDFSNRSDSITFKTPTLTTNQQLDDESDQSRATILSNTPDVAADIKAAQAESITKYSTENGMKVTTTTRIMADGTTTILITKAANETQPANGVTKPITTISQSLDKDGNITYQRTEVSTGNDTTTTIENYDPVSHKITSKVVSFKSGDSEIMNTKTLFNKDGKEQQSTTEYVTIPKSIPNATVAVPAA